MSPPATLTTTPRLDPAAVHRFVQHRLRQLWWRRLAGLLVDRLGVALLLAASVLLLVGLVRFLHGGDPVAWENVGTLLEAALVGALICTLGASPLFADVTAWIDRRAGTHDRFHTALDFSARTTLTPLEELTLAECARYVEQFPVARWTPIRLPRTLLAVVFPLGSLALLAWHGALGVGQPPHDPALQAAVARRAEALQKVAERLGREDKQAPPPDLAKLAEAMKHAAEKLKESQRQGDEQKLKTALGELSSLQAMLNAMKQAQKESKVSPGELAALAAALAASPESKDVAAAIQAGQLQQAGDQLEKLAEQMRQQGTAQQALQQLAQSMQEQASKLTEQERNEVARQMQEAAQGAQSGQEGLSQKAMQRLAELLRKAARNGGQQTARANGQGGQPLTAQQLQDLLNSLENMKEGLQPGGEGKGGGTTGQQSLARVESFNKGRGQGAKGDRASGMPGSERDEGTNEHLFADKPPDVPKAEGSARRLEGALGDGTTLQELVGANSGPARASRQYRDLYEAVAPAEQSSVEQENIPLGSRQLVRRYFENIRPAN